MFEQVESHFRDLAPSNDYCTLRIVRTQSENLAVRQDIVQPVQVEHDMGAMISLRHGSGMGYAGTSDLSRSGIEKAIQTARAWAERTAHCSVVDFSSIDLPTPTGSYRTPCVRPWNSLSLADKIDMLRKESSRLKCDPRVVDWEASLWFTQADTVFLSSDGARTQQELLFMVPNLAVVANDQSDTIIRTFGGRGYCRQGGLEVLDSVGFFDAAPTLADEALQLLAAPNCPTGTMDLLLEPDQMILQIHESIGHPLELDRILGDERNYAGTSFVTFDMFGSYTYGSELLNVTYDPTPAQEFASFGFDDDGLPAERAYIIEKGILKRPLGGSISQARAKMEGVANSRASNWNRAPIDRMANLNIEPGPHTKKEMIESVERGILMKTNCSWSIDDSRNKFQFGCEFGQLIENGKLTQVVKKPNYRGISATFWRNLTGVGDQSTYDMLGTPFCGKGEPNQVIRVGHASPSCLFSGVDVFGGV